MIEEACQALCLGKPGCQFYTWFDIHNRVFSNYCFIFSSCDKVLLHILIFFFLFFYLQSRLPVTVLGVHLDHHPVHQYLTRLFLFLKSLKYPRVHLQPLQFLNQTHLQILTKLQVYQLQQACQTQLFSHHWQGIAVWITYQPKPLQCHLQFNKQVHQTN